MERRVVTGMMLIVAIIHLIPLSGVVGAERLSLLYGVNIIGSDLEILLRHRAVLFGIFGGIFAYAAFNPNIQPLAFLVAFLSITSFLILAVSVGEFNEALRNVVLVDIFALLALLTAVVAYIRSSMVVREKSSKDSFQ